MTDEVTVELLPCPFCGGKAHIRRDPCVDGGGTFAFMECGNCGARSRSTYYSRGNDCPQTYANLRDSWNTRASMPAQGVTVKDFNDDNPERNKRINKLSLDLWDVVQDAALDRAIPSNAVWDLLVKFERDTLSALSPAPVTPERLDYFVGFEAGREAAAIEVDKCNKEGPYNAIGAASRIRAISTPPFKSGYAAPAPVTVEADMVPLAEVERFLNGTRYGGDYVAGLRLKLTGGSNDG